MQPSKPPAPVAFLFIFLALSFIQFNPSNIKNEQSDTFVVPNPTRTPPLLQAQTGRRESLEAIVPLDRITRQIFSRRTQVEPPQPDLLESDSANAAEGLEFSLAFREFIDEVADGKSGVVRGVHVPGVLTLPVIQQPNKNAAFVSEENNTLTQFQSAAQYGVTGLLAHNYLAGELFYSIDIGQDVVIVMGDGSTRRYRVSGIFRFKKLSPNNLRSSLIDLSDGKTMTTSQAFTRFYRGDHKVTFQTCLEGEGILNWGLTFLVADPVDQ